MQTRYRDRIEPGELKFTAKWGDANLNGVTLKNCVQLGAYENGVLLSLPRFFGFGELWLPRDELEVGRLVPAQWPSPESRELKTTSHRVILYRKLARAFTAEMQSDE